MRFNPK